MIAFLKLLFRNRLAAMGAVVLTFVFVLVLITPRVIRNPVQAQEVAQELRQRVGLLRNTW